MYVANVLPTIPGKTDIFTIALGTNADEALLQDIATQTGGQYYFSTGSKELQGIYNLISSEIVEEETIASKSATVNLDETKTEKVQIDPTVSKAIFVTNGPAPFSSCLRIMISMMANSSGSHAAAAMIMVNTTLTRKKAPS